MEDTKTKNKNEEIKVEEEKKSLIQTIIPNDVLNFKTLVSNLSKINKYSWEKDGNKVNNNF